MSSKVVERIPGWVERSLIPTLEARVSRIVREEVGHLEKLIDTRFEAVNERITSLESATSTRISSMEKTMDAHFDSLEKRFSMVEDLAELKTRLAAVERKISG